MTIQMHYRPYEIKLIYMEINKKSQLFNLKIYNLNNYLQYNLDIFNILEIIIW